MEAGGIVRPPMSNSADVAADGFSDAAPAGVGDVIVFLSQDFANDLVERMTGKHELCLDQDIVDTLAR